MNNLPHPTAVLYADETSGARARSAAATTGCPAALASDFFAAADADGSNASGRSRVAFHTSAVARSSQTAKAAMPRRCPTNINPKVAERNIGAASGARRRRVPAPIYPRVLAAAHLLGRRRAWLADALGLGLLAAAAVLVYLTF